MFLGIDLGTSSLKAIVLDVDGSTVGTGSATYPMATPQPGWAESDPQAWWEAAATAVHEAAGEHAVEVAAVGLCGQMHGVVLSDDAGNPLRPAILWADGRSSRQLEAYSALGQLYLSQGKLDAARDVIFMHTGGTPAIFAYVDAFRAERAGALS